MSFPRRGESQIRGQTVPLPLLRVARIVPEFCARATVPSHVTSCAERNREFFTRGVFCLFDCCTNVAELLIRKGPTELWPGCPRELPEESLFRRLGELLAELWPGRFRELPEESLFRRLRELPAELLFRRLGELPLELLFRGLGELLAELLLRCLRELPAKLLLGCLAELLVASILEFSTPEGSGVGSESALGPAHRLRALGPRARAASWRSSHAAGCPASDRSQHHPA